MKHPSGFTIIEVVVVIVVIALLGAGSYIYYLKDIQTKNQNSSSVTDTTLKQSTTPTGQLEEKDVISKDYPVLKGQTVSPDGKQRLALRSKAADGDQVLILSDSNGYGEIIIAQDPGGGGIDKITDKIWSPDSKYAYLSTFYPDAETVWLLRLDGNNFSQSNSKVLKPDNTSAGATYWPSSLQYFKWEGDKLLFGQQSYDMSWDAISGKLDVGAVSN